MALSALALMESPKLGSWQGHPLPPGLTGASQEDLRPKGHMPVPETVVQISQLRDPTLPPTPSSMTQRITRAAQRALGGRTENVNTSETEARDAFITWQTASWRRQVN